VGGRVCESDDVLDGVGLNLFAQEVPTPKLQDCVGR
jgi:hypothetical protein